MKRIATKLIDFYRFFLSPIKRFFKYLGFFKNSSCVFYPTCSEYGRIAINKYGFAKGVYLTFFRILRCHPWQENHIDPVP